MDYSFVIPCYNEAANVAQLRDQLLPVVSGILNVQQSDSQRDGTAEVIFVDDGSRDDTQAALSVLFRTSVDDRISLRIERHSLNLGLGAALRTGFGCAQGRIIVTTDSDGTYRFSTIPALLACLTPDVDMVTASPYHPLGGVDNVPAYRLMLSRGSSWMYRMLLGSHVHTYTALFRAYRREMLESVPFCANGFLAGTQILVNGILMGYRVAEYPTVLHGRVQGASKARLLRTIGAHLDYQRQIALIRMGRGHLERSTLPGGNA